MRNQDVLDSLRFAGQVERYHTWPTLRKPSVAESTWHVMRVYLEVFGSPRAEVWHYMLLHDVDEIATGDVPFNAKRRWPALKAAVDSAEVDHRRTQGRIIPELTEIEWLRFKVCDLIEMAEFALVEVAMGNQYAQVIIDNIADAVSDIRLGDADTALVVEHLKRLGLNDSWG